MDLAKAQSNLSCFGSDSLGQLGQGTVLENASDETSSLLKVSLSSTSSTSESGEVVTASEELSRVVGNHTHVRDHTAGRGGHETEEVVDEVVARALVVRDLDSSLLLAWLADGTGRDGVSGESHVSEGLENHLHSDNVLSAISGAIEDNLPDFFVDEVVCAIGREVTMSGAGNLVVLAVEDLETSEGVTVHASGKTARSILFAQAVNHDVIVTLEALQLTAVVLKHSCHIHLRFVAFVEPR